MLWGMLWGRYTLFDEFSMFFLLKLIGNLEKDGISINTWHIIDPESLFSLQLGITDRKLKYDMNEFLTYSKENPLLNTAYKIKYIQKAYKKE